MLENKLSYINIITNKKKNKNSYYKKKFNSVFNKNKNRNKIFKDLIQDSNLSSIYDNKFSKHNFEDSDSFTEKTWKNLKKYNDEQFDNKLGEELIKFNNFFFKKKKFKLDTKKKVNIKNIIKLKPNNYNINSNFKMKYLNKICIKNISIENLKSVLSSNCYTKTNKSNSIKNKKNYKINFKSATRSKININNIVKSKKLSQNKPILSFKNKLNFKFIKNINVKKVMKDIGKIKNNKKKFQKFYLKL